ncbi:peptidase [Natrinema sp. SYSU A 869]|uniref:peptidase n=1 Tax=Natrinema sp. SYSU A 869 TaxID=2871694 RepID=UPI001CA40B68|nr:peptidase [Natrinema sp. SYSU A 869]
MISVLARWFGLLVVGYATGRLYGRYAVRRRGDGEDDRQSRGTHRLLAVVGLATFLTLVFSGLVAGTETALSSVHPALSGGLAAPLAWVPTAAGTIVTVLVTYLGVFPYAREHNDLEISAVTAVARLAKYLAAIAIFCLGAIAPVTVLLETSDPNLRLILLLFAVLAIGTYGWLQHNIRLSQAVSNPTAEQRRRLEAAANRTDLTATIAGVFPGKETETAILSLEGPFWNRRLYATDYAFDVLDDAELTALCARADAADELWLLERRSLVMAGLFSLFLSLTVWTSVILALAVLVVVWSLCCRHCQRCEVAADHRAADEVGADVLASAYKAAPNLTDDRSWLHERLAATPSTARRLERLRNYSSH